MSYGIGKLKGEIIFAFTQELKALFADDSVTILVKTDYKNSGMPTFKFPLVEVDMQPGGDSGQFLGGITMEDYHCTLNVYALQQDTPEDPTNYSATLVDIVDQVRQQFSNFSKFLSAEMLAAFDTYGMKLTYSGAGDAHALEHQDGTAMGTALHFAVVAFDNSTTGSQFVTEFGGATPEPPDTAQQGVETWGIVEW